MAVQSDTSRIQYAGNNSTTTSYAVPFVFQENSHLKAIARTSTGVETVVTLTNHTGAGNVNGGTVRTAVAVPATSTLTIYREVPATQTTTYAEGGDFPAASHERALDKLTQIAQQLDRKVGSAIRLSAATQLPDLNPPLTNQQHILSSVGGAAPSWQALPSLSIGPVIATGSTAARSVQDRFADVVNVRDFGAVGDGVTDDRAAFVAAAAAATEQSKTLVIPSGDYVVSGNLITVGNIHIVCYGNVTGPNVIHDTPFFGDNFYFRKVQKNQSVFHANNQDTVGDDESRERASIFTRSWYDGIATENAWYNSGNANHTYIHYGARRKLVGQRASGTKAAVCGQVNVFSLDNGTGGVGRTEVLSWAGGLTCAPDADINAAANYYNEFSINGPTGTSESDPQRESFLAGASFLIQKFCPGNAKDADHKGSYGITVTTRPGMGGFDLPRPNNVENYKLFAGIAVNGWSGVWGTATSGSVAAANSAFEWGILVGGQGTNWTPHDSISKIDTGIGIRDYVFWGLQIFSRNPNPNADSGAIAVYANAGPSLFGMSSAAGDTVTKVQAQAQGQFDNGIRIWPTSHATSERAGLRLDDWVLAQDSAGNGTKNLFLFQGAAPATRMIVSTSGDVAIGNVTPSSKLHVNGDVTVTNATTATSAAAGSNGDVPAQVEGYLVVNINGTARRIPYYNAP